MKYWCGCFVISWTSSRRRLSIEFKDITNNDMHVIEAIGIGAPKNMSSIAKELSVTVGTLTIAMNSLVKKGMLCAAAAMQTAELYTFPCLTGDEALTNTTRCFHREMIQSVMEELEPGELETLIRALTKLNDWFRGWKKE